MILEVVLPVPDGWTVGPETNFGVIGDAEVRDLATGVIGNVRSARLNWRGGHAEIVATIEVDDDSAVAAAVRNGPIF